MNEDFPCYCRHQLKKHVMDRGGMNLCLMCVPSILKIGEGEYKVEEYFESTYWYHTYKPDNIKYLENESGK